ncbi:hypothetical protein M231_06317 [Tremella mesenterica]|uniref:Uncharacterized protein n=1 Tax=Tremella mesenterica TaxID=5217 RepID=A0A4Q1BFA4_TREME|nr:hypothetical protein M231_06317 [Tremella mesenterica]
MSHRDFSDLSNFSFPSIPRDTQPRPFSSGPFDPSHPFRDFGHDPLFTGWNHTPPKPRSSRFAKFFEEQFPTVVDVQPQRSPVGSTQEYEWREEEAEAQRGQDEKDLREQVEENWSYEEEYWQTKEEFEFDSDPYPDSDDTELGREEVIQQDLETALEVPDDEKVVETTQEEHYNEFSVEEEETHHQVDVTKESKTSGKSTIPPRLGRSRRKAKRRAKLQQTQGSTTAQEESVDSYDGNELNQTNSAESIENNSPTVEKATLTSSTNTTAQTEASRISKAKKKRERRKLTRTGQSQLQNTVDSDEEMLCKYQELAEEERKSLIPTPTEDKSKSDLSSYRSILADGTYDHCRKNLADITKLIKNARDDGEKQRWKSLQPELNLCNSLVISTLVFEVEKGYRHNLSTHRCSEVDCEMNIATRARQELNAHPVNKYILNTVGEDDTRTALTVKQRNDLNEYIRVFADPELDLIYRRLWTAGKWVGPRKRGRDLWRQITTTAYATYPKSDKVTTTNRASAVEGVDIEQVTKRITALTLEEQGYSRGESSKRSLRPEDLQ